MEVANRNHRSAGGSAASPCSASGRSGVGLALRVRGRFLPSRFALLALLGMTLGGTGQAVAQVLSEYQVKAAFIFNFMKFVDWPTDSSPAPNDPWKVCVIGEDPFNHGLEAVMARKSLGGRNFEIHHVSNAQEARSCDVLFISSSERNRVGSIVAGMKGTSVLTVGDSPGFAKQGCMIDFLLEDNRLRFEINVGAASSAGLKISSKLLNLAKFVWE